MKTISTNELKRKLKNESYYIYGLGTASSRFMSVLVKMDYLKNFKGYIISDEINKRAYNINKFNDKEALIFIATHAVNAVEIEKTLEKKKFTNYYWIYPNIFEMELGDDPIQSDCEMQIKDVIKRFGYRNRLCLACHLHFIEGVLSGNERDKSYYIRLHSIFAEEKTVKTKARQFENRILEAKTKGMNDTNPILISQSGVLIDGHHRLSMAYYFGHKMISANVYTDSSCENCLRLIEAYSLESMQDVDMSIIDEIAKGRGC